MLWLPNESSRFRWGLAAALCCSPDLVDFGRLLSASFSFHPSVDAREEKKTTKKTRTAQARRLSPAPCLRAHHLGGCAGMMASGFLSDQAFGEIVSSPLAHERSKIFFLQRHPMKAFHSSDHWPSEPTC